MKNLKFKRRYLLGLIIPAAILVFFSTKVSANDVFVVRSDAELIDIIATSIRGGKRIVNTRYYGPNPTSANYTNALKEGTKKAGAYYSSSKTCARNNWSALSESVQYYTDCEAGYEQAEYVTKYANQVAKELFAKTQDKGELVNLLTQKIKSEFKIGMPLDLNAIPNVYGLVKDKQGYGDLINLLASKILSDLNIDNVLIKGNNQQFISEWLLVKINNVWYHYDLGEDMSNNTNSRTLKSSKTMISLGYVWDVNGYPKSETDFATTIKEKTVLGETAYEQKLETAELVKSDVPTVDTTAITKGTSSWATETVLKAYQEDLIPFYMVGNYQKPITREEFASLVVILYQKLGGPLVEIKPAPFTDTYNSDVTMAYSMGLVNGVGNNKYAPTNLVTREQIAVMYNNLIKVLNIQPIINTGTIIFADSSNISSWAMESIQTLYKMNIITGVGGNKINPKGNATIEQAIILSYRLFENLTN